MKSLSRIPFSGCMKGSPDLARVRPFFHDFRKNLGGMGRVPGACLQKVSFVRPILSQTPPTSLFSYRGHRRRGGVAPVRDLANRCCVAPRGLSHSPQGSFRSPLPCGGTRGRKRSSAPAPAVVYEGSHRQPSFASTFFAATRNASSRHYPYFRDFL